MFWYRSFTRMLQLLFYSLLTFSSCPNEKVDCKMSTKSLNNHKWKTSWYFSTTAHARVYSQYWKRQPKWKKELIGYSSHTWIVFLEFLGFHLEKENVCFNFDVKVQGGGRILDAFWRGVATCQYDTRIIKAYFYFFI